MARRKLEGLTGLCAAALAATMLAGCASVGGGRANCDIVRLQRGAGRSDADIASALNVGEADVSACAGGSAAASGGSEGPAPWAATGAEAGTAPSGGEAGSSGDSATEGKPHM